MNIYYFNPDNDLALANGDEHYTPTPMARQLQQDLQLLPCWIAEPGSMVLCDDASHQGWADQHRLDVRVITPSDLPGIKDATLRPWGWSPAMRWRFLRWGIHESLLPSGEQIERWRALSHRRTSITIHNRINEILGRKFCPTPVELDNIDDILHFAQLHPQCFVKEPWSGSGHGIYRALNANGRDFVQRCTGALNRQGSMLCEQAYDRTLDFAVELECRKGTTQVIGYSIFQNDFHLQYSHGKVDKNENLRKTIVSQFADFHLIESAIVKVIGELLSPDYDGYVGIDMLTYREHDNNIGINPCVELNLRTTMGAVTAALGDRHNMNGIFSIIPSEHLNANDIPLTPTNNKWVAVIKPI